MKLKNFLLLSLLIGGLWAVFANKEKLDAQITQFNQQRQAQEKQAAYDKQFRDVDWGDGMGGRLKMRIPRKYISEIYKRTEKKPYEWIIMRASYPKFQSDKEIKNLNTPRMLRIRLEEKQKDPLLFANNVRVHAEYDVREKRAYLYPNDWGLNHYKSIICVDTYPGVGFSKEFLRRRDSLRDELTPTDCWISLSSPEKFVPKKNTYSIKYSCTSLTTRPDGWGGCTVFTHYRNKRLNYVMRRNMIPQWKAIHEGVLRFLDQFVVIEQPNAKTED